ncbi:hypothetical protein QE152_g38741 [Popillia japonica]|uniref:Transposase n=1 Tax=Popillia japonica TaxID=7064 RepID=A0AAW1HW56_POPJA
MCSKHFVNTDYKWNLQHEILGYTNKRCRQLNEDAVPTKNLPKQPQSCTGSVSRAERSKQRDKAKRVKELLNSKDYLRSASASLIIIGNGVLSNNISDGVGKCTTELSPSNALIPNSSDVGVNTEVDERDQTIWDLKARNEFLEEENKSILKQFSPTQLRKLREPYKRFNWSVQDVQKAIVNILLIHELIGYF